ncbi:MAG: 2-oxoglutarate dehydrogenase complex dihydrolipoyllysine-residue succinyltransferase [Ahrensia sp.]|nr:2-oxoglutarate dehydrogenase complex dihydrolipoyllysine-residue succinyltransferase [Ahrensia sp.]
MATEIRVPTLGESVTEATIGTWFKKVGDAVADGETLLELETDKVTLEVPAPSAGVLSEIVAKEGDTVEVNALLAMLSVGDAAAAAPAPAPKAEPAPVAEVAKPAVEAMPAAPSAAKLMAENNIASGDVDGSGKRGQVLKGDVLAAMAASASTSVEMPKVSSSPSAPSAPRVTQGDDASREERVKMTRLRQTIARRLKDAQNSAAMLTTYNEVDMTAVMEMRTKYKDLFEKKHGVKLGFMGFFTKAVCHALQEIPAVNAEIDGTDIIYKHFCHIGVAVGTEKGLVVPVVRDAHDMGIADVEKEIGRLGRAARDGQLSMADMQGGTFTISNGGVYGSLMSSPILNAPQSGILGMHKIQDRPVAINGQVVIRPMMYLALSYDHRIVDGKEAVTFLVRVKESLEDPERLVLDL